VSGLDIIIINYGTRDRLAACLRSLRAHPSEGPCRLLVVDSGSTDDSVAFVRREFPEVELIALPDNRGFGRAANIGLRLTVHDTVVLLNADTELTDDLLTPLHRLLQERPGVGVVGPRHVDDRGHEQLTCGERPTLLAEWRRRQRHLRGANGPVVTADAGAVQWVSGSAMMIRREALRRAGLFDESFFLYFEDIDLCLRIGRAGFTIRYAPQGTIRHHGGASTQLTPARSDYEYRRSQLRFWRKHGGILTRVAVRAWIALRYAGWWLAGRLAVSSPPCDAAHARRVLSLVWRGGA
jgi:GT2 family glycosyltransferase